MTSSERDRSETATHVSFTSDSLRVDLSDGRTISAPLAWYPRLLAASPAQRAEWQLLGAGVVIHWPQIDEDLSIAGLLKGAPASGSRMAG